MVSTVAYATGEPTAYVTGLLSTLRIGHPAAKHDGEPFTYMGKPAVRWRWHPVAIQAPTAAPQTQPHDHTPEPATAPLWGSPQHYATVRAEMQAGDFTRAAELAAASAGFPSIAAWREHRELADMLGTEGPEAEQTD